MEKRTYIIAERRKDHSAIVAEYRPWDHVRYWIKTVDAHGFKSEAAALEFAQKHGLEWELHNDRS